MPPPAKDWKQIYRIHEISTKYEYGYSTSSKSKAQETNTGCIEREVVNISIHFGRRDKE